MNSSKCVMVVAICIFSVMSLGCEDPGTASLKATMEQRTASEKAKLEHDVELRKLALEERKLDMEEEQARFDRENPQDQEEDDPADADADENTAAAAAEDSGVKVDATGTGTDGTAVSAELSNK